MMADAKTERIPLSGKESLGKVAVTGSMWTIFGFGGQQVLRMATQVVIVNQLMPEAVGLFVLVSIWVQGIQLFTDMGIGANIIQNERGNETVFLRTAWTLQIARGFVIFALVVAAAYPLSRHYDQPLLLWLLPIAATEAMCNGFATTSIFLANRRLQMRWVTMLDLGANLAGAAVAITWVLIQPTVWAYLALPVTRSIVRLAASHVLFTEPRMGVQFDWDVVRSIFKFGKWIFVSSILGFLSGSFDRLVLPDLLKNLSEFGVYGVAVLWARGVLNALHAISHKVLLPLYTHMANDDRGDFASRILRVRGTLLLFSLPIVYFFILFGEQFIHVVHGDRYSEAGWMLQVLASGAAISAVVATTLCVLLAVGDSFRFMLFLFTSLVVIASTMFIGYTIDTTWLLGYDISPTTGVIIGIACAELVNYPTVAVLTHRYGVWLPKLDLPLFALTGFVVWIAFWVI
jgi:O-antigen/teichoic acid export membrane protein